MDKKLIKYAIIWGFTLFGLLQSCAQPVDNDEDNNGNTDSVSTKILVQKVGQASTFELMTWNIENFPKPNNYDVNINRTIDNVKTLIKNLDVDLIAVQEIVDATKFNELITGLDNWDGKLNAYPDSYSGYQHTGLIYKSDMISVENPGYILEKYNYEFAGRPPFVAYIKVKNNTNQVVFDFNIIVLHLKAYGDEESEERRRDACALLEDYIRDEISAGADPDFVVLGDWNDELKDDRANNVFNVFLDKPADYTFLTSGLSGQYSYIPGSYNSLIDNIMISNDVINEFGNGETKVLYLDSEFKKYPDQVSDHRPVMAKFGGITLN